MAARKVKYIGEFPIQIFRPMGDGAQHLALIDVGTMRFVFLAPTAMAARRVAKEWVAKHCKAEPKDQPE